MKKLKNILLFTLIALLGAAGTSYSQGQGDFLDFSDASLEVKNRIELYPNPATEYINVEIKESDLISTYIILHNIIGNSIVIHPEKISENKYRIDVKELPAGYYLLSVKDPATKFNRTYKFLKR